MKTYIILAILAFFFLYLVVWSFKLFFYDKRKKKVKRLKALRAKGNEIKKRTIDCTKDYWYNLREIEDCKEGEDFEKYYHYFIGVEQGVHELLLEMYDCGIVRTDELEEIAYGGNHLHHVDLSFLQELDTDSEEEVIKEDDSGYNVIQVEGVFSDFAEPKEQDIVTAARNLKKNDPGIVDIRGTLSAGVEDVIAAVELEKKEQEEEDEPIVTKRKRSIEEVRKARERTSNAEVRGKIYEKWVGYVFRLYELVNINANEDTKHKIRKALMDYGYNDVDVLLESPE